MTKCSLRVLPIFSYCHIHLTSAKIFLDLGDCSITNVKLKNIFSVWCKQCTNTFSERILTHFVFDNVAIPCNLASDFFLCFFSCFISNTVIHYQCSGGNIWQNSLYYCLLNLTTWQIVGREFGSKAVFSWIT